MQNFEPSGVFATNLKECLLLQLQNNDNLSNSKKIIVENLELLGEGNLRELQKLTELNDKELRENIKEIRLLNPKPGFKYSDDNSQVLSPDVIVSKNNTNWSVELNNSTLPKKLQLIRNMQKKLKVLNAQNQIKNILLKI